MQEGKHRKTSGEKLPECPAKAHKVVANPRAEEIAQKQQNGVDKSHDIQNFCCDI
jgi:hypothetical protein